MNPASFLCGTLVAWTVAQVALTAYFALAYVVARRQFTYLLFALLCFALAFTTFGMALSYAGSRASAMLQSSYLTVSGAIAAAALNLHFALRYAGVRRSRRWMTAVYAAAVPYEVLVWTGHWWRPHTTRPIVMHFSGRTLIQYSVTPNFAGLSFYAIAFTEVLAATALLYWAYRRGRKETLISMVGSAIVALCVMNDLLLLLGQVHSVYLTPHGFLVYAFAVASTLLVQLRRDTGQLEETASSLRQELRHSHAELRQAQNELVVKRQLAAVGELAAAIAHEVRNPLAVIVNAVAGLRRKGLGDPDRTMLLGIVEEEAARLNRLVTDLLRFARPVSVNYSQVSLRELARRAEDSARQNQVVEVRMGDDPELSMVSADLGLLRLVFDNVIENALQSMPDGGCLTISAERETVGNQDFVRVDVRDTGQGMDRDVRERATDPFFTTRPSGTGLGLPIVERIMVAHGGRIQIESTRGVGTTVSLFIPLEPKRGAESVARMPVGSPRA